VAPFYPPDPVVEEEFPTEFTQDEVTPVSEEVTTLPEEPTTPVTEPEVTTPTV